MNTSTSTSYSKQHPMIIAAAVAVVLFCLVGTAAVLGWIPSSMGSNAAPLSDADRAAMAAPLPSPSSQLAATNAPTAAPMVPTMAPPVAMQDNYAPTAAPGKTWCANCGNVESVREITTRAQGSGVGAAGGAILGGLLGNQIGSGHGRQLATVAGAVGGAVAGNQVEGNMNATRSYEIRVRLDDGSSRTFHQKNAPGWHNGDRVKVVNGSLHSVQ